MQGHHCKKWWWEMLIVREAVHGGGRTYTGNLYAFLSTLL